MKNKMKLDKLRKKLLKEKEASNFRIKKKK